MGDPKCRLVPPLIAKPGHAFIPFKQVEGGAAALQQVICDAVDSQI